MNVGMNHEKDLLIWKKLIDFRISQDIDRRNRMKTLILAQCFVMLGFTFALSQAFSIEETIAHCVFLGLANALCIAGIFLAFQGLRCHARLALALRQISRQIDQVESRLHVPAVGHLDNKPSLPGLGKDQLRIFYVREAAPTDALPSRPSPRNPNRVSSPDRTLLCFGGTFWILALVCTFMVTSMKLSPAFQIAAEKLDHRVALAER